MSTDEIFTNSSMFNRILGNGHTNSLGNSDRVGGYTGSDGEGRIRAVDISYGNQTKHLKWLFCI